MARRRKSHVRSCFTRVIAEQLERRRLLDGNPVIVIAEPFYAGATGHNRPGDATLINDYLWNNPNAAPFDVPFQDSAPTVNPWSSGGGDGAPGTGGGDDYYGWDFSNTTPGDSEPEDSPQVYTYNQSEDYSHVEYVTDYTVEALNAASEINGEMASLVSTVKIMYVVGTATQIKDYVLYEKQSEGINIVAIGTSRAGFGVGFTDNQARCLAAANILIFENSDENQVADIDTSVGQIADDATPRYNEIGSPLDNVIPVTTDPNLNLTATGNNSIYFALPFGLQSWLCGPAAADAAIAVAAYQSENDGQSPTYEQVKEAMMGGVTYEPQLAGDTITEGLTPAGDAGGGLLADIGKVVTAIDTWSDVTTVNASTTSSSFSPGSEATINLSADNDVSSYTINWGDGTSSEVLSGSAISASHPYGYLGDNHTYYVTVFAISGTTVQGDINCDGIVNQGDINIITSHFNETGAPSPAFAAMGDVNGDGIIDQLDLDIVIEHWEETPTPGLISYASPTTVVISAMPAGSGADHTYTVSKDGNDIQVVRQGPDGTYSWSGTYFDVPYLWLSLDDSSDTVNLDLAGGDPRPAINNMLGASGFQIAATNNALSDTLNVATGTNNNIVVSELQIDISSYPSVIPDMNVNIELNDPSDSVDLVVPLSGEQSIVVNGQSDADVVEVDEMDPNVNDAGYSTISVNNVGELVLGELADSSMVLSVNASDVQIGAFADITENNVGKVLLNSSPGSTVSIYELDINGGRLEMMPGQDLTLDIAGNLLITGDGVLDLSDNAMTLRVYDTVDPSLLTDALSEIYGLLQIGYDGGLWDGLGLTSSSAAADPDHVMALGFAVTTRYIGSHKLYSDVYVKYTHYGDYNLDGVVNQTDLNIVTANWESTGAYWYQGDANYDNLVNQLDINAVTQGWQWTQ